MANREHKADKKKEEKRAKKSMIKTSRVNKMITYVNILLTRD